MSNLNPNIPSSELSRLMTTATAKMSKFGLSYLTPQLLLRTFLEEKESAAHRILLVLKKQRGFDMGDLGRRVEMMTEHSRGRDAAFHFTDDFGKDIPLSEEMLVVIDEGLTIAQAREELKAGSGHVLAAMAQQNVTTYAVLQRIGVTSAAVIASLEDVDTDGSPILIDYVHEAKQGNATAVYQRHELLQELMSLLSLSQRRHVILVGPEGSGKRTLAYSLAQLLAEGKGPENLRSLVEISETALLENPLAAMRPALRRATGGVLLVPGIERFFADRLRAQFPESVNRELHKALLNSEQVIIGTATVAGYDRISRRAILRQNSHRLDVPAATRDETIAMLSFHKQQLEQEYEIEVLRESLETAAVLASQYIKTIALPAAAVQLANRACALVRMVMQEHIANLPEVTPDGRLSSDDVMVAASQMTKIPITKLSEDEQSKYANIGRTAS